MSEEDDRSEVKAQPGDSEVSFSALKLLYGNIAIEYSYGLKVGNHLVYIWSGPAPRVLRPKTI